MGFWSAIFAPKKAAREGYLSLQDRNEALEYWKAVEDQARFGKPSNYRAAVIDADKILEFVLERLYPNLTTTGERLKAAKAKFVGNYEIYDGLWFAHKVRNEIVHNVNFDLPSAQVSDILDKFKAGLVHLGAI